MVRHVVVHHRVHHWRSSTHLHMLSISWHHHVILRVPWHLVGMMRHVLNLVVVGRWLVMNALLNIWMHSMRSWTAHHHVMVLILVHMRHLVSHR